jgi:hypothetical protein
MSSHGDQMKTALQGNSLRVAREKVFGARGTLQLCNLARQLNVCCRA